MFSLKHGGAKLGCTTATMAGLFFKQVSTFANSIPFSRSLYCLNEEELNFVPQELCAEELFNYFLVLIEDGTVFNIEIYLDIISFYIIFH